MRQIEPIAQKNNQYINFRHNKIQIYQKMITNVVRLL